MCTCVRVRVRLSTVTQAGEGTVVSPALSLALGSWSQTTARLTRDTQGPVRVTEASGSAPLQEPRFPVFQCVSQSSAAECLGHSQGGHRLPPGNTGKCFLKPLLELKAT